MGGKAIALRPEDPPRQPFDRSRRHRRLLMSSPRTRGPQPPAVLRLARPRPSAFPDATIAPMTEPARSFVATPVERRVVVAPGVALHVEQRRGDRAAAPFVLVHGLASNARLWDGVAEHLHASGHTVIAIDQRGHGRSDAPETGYDLDPPRADPPALIGPPEPHPPVLPRP